MRGKAGQNGTVFVITGSAAMKITDMNVQVADNMNNEILVDQEVRKIFRLSPKGQQLRVAPRSGISRYLHRRTFRPDTELQHALRSRQLASHVLSVEHSRKSQKHVWVTSLRENSLAKFATLRATLRVANFPIDPQKHERLVPGT